MIEGNCGEDGRSVGSGYEVFPLFFYKVKLFIISSADCAAILKIHNCVLRRGRFLEETESFQGHDCKGLQTVAFKGLGSPLPS